MRAAGGAGWSWRWRWPLARDPARARASAPAPPRCPSTTVVLGETSTVPDPSCPELPCQAIGSVTGFQVSNGQTRSPFLVPHDGTIKSWTLTLAQPTNKQRSFFNGFFGTPPQARLAILRRIPGTNPPRYNLRSQGSVKVLSPYLGPDGQIRRLAESRKGRHRRPHRPDLGPGLRPGPARQQRLARQPRAGQMHQLHRRPPGRAPEKVGRRADYGCNYSTARLLYTAPRRGLAPPKRGSARWPLPERLELRSVRRSRSLGLSERGETLKQLSGRGTRPLPALRRLRAEPSASPGLSAAPPRWRSGSGTR